ncbi:MAG TPA: AI-2E family transporter [Planctomycetota bacterium]|nr:AI-2E family transporter [Planctomycetota bacterium]
MTTSITTPDRAAPATGPVRSPIGGSTTASIVLATLAVAYTLAIARPFLMPIAFAWLANSALTPVVRFGRRWGLPAPLTAAAIVFTLTAGGMIGAYRLSAPASAWAERLPEDIRVIQGKLRSDMGDMRTPMETMAKATEAVATIADGTPARDKPLQVAVVSNRPSANLLSGMWDIGANLTITLVLLYFMLATGDAFLTKVVEVMPRLSDAKAVVATARAIEDGIARYLTTVLSINLVLGVLVGTTCWLLGLPNPALWGAMAAIFNFVPYVGALCGIAVVAAVGLTSLDGLIEGLVPATIYALITAMEGMFLTPVIVGRRMTLSPVFVFVWLLLMSWLWGIPGALLAVPILAAGKIVCDHVPRLQVLGRFLGA